MNHLVPHTELFSGYGGFGYTSRMWGLILDNIIAMDVVVANGTSYHASEHEHADLFWVSTSFCSKYRSLALTAAN
jgi:FAD/FMN-containing dehydrogenase